MKKIKNAYLHAHRFCELMQAYKFNKYPYNLALEDSEYIQYEKELKGFDVKKINIDTLLVVIGYVLYSAFNPFKWIEAKKYYNSKTFGKPKTKLEK